jgi:hypothetical protein
VDDEAARFLGAVDRLGEPAFAFMRRAGWIVLGIAAISVTATIAALGALLFGSNDVRAWLAVNDVIEVITGLGFMAVMAAIAVLGISFPAIAFVVLVMRQRRWGYGEDGVCMSLAVRLGQAEQPCTTTPDYVGRFTCAGTPGLRHSRLYCDADCLRQLCKWARVRAGLDPAPRKPKRRKSAAA